MKIMEWLWSFLPDECEVDDCCRAGMRGNENRIHPWPERYPDLYVLVCDYCNSKYMRGDVLKVNGLLPYLTRGINVALFDEAVRKKRREHDNTD